MSQRLRLPEDTYFRCQSCGRCCTKWAVPVSAARAEALRQHDWGGTDPFVPNPGPGDPFRTRMINGRCFFLEEDNRCRIHSQLSYDEKPDACKAFPLKFTKVGGIDYARMSFYCPTVSRNEGKRIEQQMKWVRAVQKSAGQTQRTRPLELAEDLPISSKVLSHIERVLLDILAQEDKRFSSRMAACAGLLKRLLTAAEAADSSDKVLTHALKKAESTSFETLEEEGRTGGKASHAGPLYSLLLGQDAPPKKLHKLLHFFGVRFFHLGLTKLRSHTLGVQASASQLARVAFEPLDEPSKAYLLRYFRSKLKGQRHLADDNSLLSGFHILAAAFGMLHLLSRLRAAAVGRTKVEYADIEAAVQATDLLVVEHPALFHAELSATLLNNMLHNPNLCASILARFPDTPQ